MGVSFEIEPTTNKEYSTKIKRDKLNHTKSISVKVEGGFLKHIDPTFFLTIQMLLSMHNDL